MTSNQGPSRGMIIAGVVGALLLLGIVFVGGVIVTLMLLPARESAPPPPVVGVSTAPLSIGVQSTSGEPAPGGQGHLLIHEGSQQGRPEPPPEALASAQCSELPDGGQILADGVTGILNCGDTVIGHTRGGYRAFDTRFYEHHFCTPATTQHDGGDERIYRLRMPEGRFRAWVTLDTPCADLDLAVIKWDHPGLPGFDSVVDDCEMFPKDGSRREIVDVTSEGDSDWLVVVEGKGEEEGAFGLTVQCVPW
jgi:hypothetical protein